MFKQVLILVLLPLLLWDCDFGILGRDGGKDSSGDSAGVSRPPPDRNHGAEQKIHWTGMATWTIPQGSQPLPHFSHLRQYDKDSLLVHEFYYYPLEFRGVYYGTLHEDSNWYDDQARLVFKKQFYGPPTFLRRPMDVHYVYRTGNTIDSIVDTVFETSSRNQVRDVIKSRIASSRDGRFDSVFVQVKLSPDLLTTLFETDSANKVLKKLSFRYDFSISAAAQDTEIVTIKYRDDALVHKEYEVIVYARVSQNDSIAYTYSKDGKMDSVFIYKSGVLHSRGKVDYRVIYDMEQEIQSIHNFATVYKRAAGFAADPGFFIPPCHNSY